MSEEPHPRPAERAVLAFASLGGGIAWTAHLLSAYAIAEFGCIGSAHAHRALGISLISWLLLVSSLACVALAAAALGVAWKLHRRRGGWSLDQSEDPALGIAQAGVVADAVFILIIACQAVPIFYYFQGC